MIIYRVETADIGTGPFHIEEGNLVWPEDQADYELECQNHLDCYNANSRFQQPHRWMLNHGAVCGCESMEQLREWFSDRMIDILSRAGYLIQTYRVKKVNRCVSMPNQVTFRRKNAKQLEAYDIAHLKDY